MSVNRRTLAVAIAVALIPAFSPLAAAEVDDATLRALLDRLERLEQRLGTEQPIATSAQPEPDQVVAELQQRLAILERKIEIQAEEAAAKAPTTPAVSINEKGLAVKTPKGDFEFKVRGGLQLDHRAFLDDDDAFNDGFLFRRIRPTLEGRLGPLVGFRITPELAEETASLIDATIDVNFDPRWSLRVGKMKGPVGLERLVSFSAMPMIERGFPTELAPSREVGAQVFGELAQGRVTYAIGLFNGAPDGRNGTASNSDGEHEWEGRVFLEPWRNAANALSGLGFGLAGSIGDKQGAGNNFLPRYRTPGQNVFFNYRSTVIANGEHRRLSPQAYYYRNALGLLGECIVSEQDVGLTNNATANTTLKHDAWQLTASWVLTGEDASYRGIAKPNQPFAAGADGWGAFELVARYGELDVDDDAFPLYASADSAASRAQAWGIGLNWYLTSNLKLVVNHARARFSGGAAGGADREDEKTVFSRIQVAF